MGICGSIVKGHNKEIICDDETSAVYEPAPLVLMNTIQMKDIKLEIIMDKSRLRKQNINSIYLKEEQRYKNKYMK